jgi:predicted nucleic acid-binding protein
MKRFLFISILLIKTVYGQNIPTTDTICFPISVAQKVLIDAKQGKVLKEQVSILNERIAILEELTKELKKKDSLTVISYEKQIKEMKDQRKILETGLDTLNKALRKQRRKTKWTAIAGIVSTAGAIFLFK